MPLTQFTIHNARAKDKPYKLPDGGGLHLLVQVNGSKLWRLRYRFGSAEKMLSLGAYPAVSLASARAKREEAKKLLADGTDPSRQRKLEKYARAVDAQNTFGSIAAEYVANLEAQKAAVTTLEKNRWLLQDLATPLSDRPISAITPAEVLDVLKRVEKSGRRETARRLRGTIGCVFRYAVATLRATSDPTAALRGALLKPNLNHRAAITDERELGILMRSVDEYDGWPTIRAAMQLLALTMTRPGDVRFMRRSEIDFAKAMWRIPAERMKMRLPHDVPLSRQALAILQDIWPLSDGGDLTLPSVRSLKKPLSECAMNSALRRMGYTKDDMCPHGFRAAASTILNGRGFNPDVVEAALAHQDRNAIRRAYNRATYWPERITLMQQWADMLDEFRQRAIDKRHAA
jgi:integrase